LIRSRRNVQNDITNVVTGARGCPNATPQLQQQCKDTWETSPTDCCWCDEGGRRCLIRARRSNLFFVPKEVEVSVEPHFRDWRGKSWDYQGVDDHVLAEVGGFRVDVKLSPCSEKSRVTCITEAALVDTVAGKTVQFKADVVDPFACGDNKLVADGNVIKAGGITLRKDDSGDSVAIWTARLGDVLRVQVLVEKDLLDVIVTVASGFKSSLVKGGLLTGAEKGLLKQIWANVVDRLGDKAVRVSAPAAFKTALSWRLKPENSFICSTKAAPYKFDKVIEVPKTRVGLIVIPEQRLRYFECCRYVLCSPEAFDECVFDHVELNGNNDAKKCIKGYSTLAEETCQRVTGGDCRGGWTTWNECANGEQTRRFVIEKSAIPGFDDCVRRHGEVEIRDC